MTLVSSARISFALSCEEATTFQFLGLSMQLLSGYLASCPDSEKSVMKQAYFDSKRTQEQEWNRKHSEKITKVKQEFDRFKGKALQSDDPVLYNDMKFRVVHDAEDECLHEEHGEFAHGIYLKIDSTTFTPDRFLQIFLKQNVKRPEEKKADEKQILEANDSVYLEANRLQGGNTVLGRFSEELLGHVRVIANGILKNKGLVSGELFKSKVILEKMAYTERQLLLMHFFTDLFFQLETIYGSGYLRIMSQNKNAEKNLGCKFLDDAVLTELGSVKERLFKIIDSRDKYICDSADVERVNDFGPRFLEGCKVLCAAMSDYHTLLQVKLKMDFTKAVAPVPVLAAAFAPARSRASSMSNSQSLSNSLSSNSLSSSGSLSPRATDSPKLSPRIPPNSGAGMALPRASTVPQVQELIIHDGKQIQKYVSAFTTIMEIFQKIVHAEKAKSPGNIFGF
jgi:hypothetical protein